MTMGAIRQACERIAGSGRFQAFIFGVIVFNAVVLGLETYEAVDDRIGDLLAAANAACLGIFVVELAIRIAAYGRRPQDFFRDGWNVFDFVVVGAALLPGIRENVTLLRIIRLLRVVRVVTVLPDLRILVRALARSIPPILSLVVLTAMLMYVYAMVGWILFGDEAPGNWGNIGEALLSTFTMLTLENWPLLLEEGIAIHPASWIFFVSYVLLASFLVINILIAIIINSMDEVHEAEREEERARRLGHLDAGDEDGVTIAERLEGLRAAIDDLELDLERDGGAPAKTRLSRPTKGGRARM